MRVMSFNIRLNDTDENYGEQKWELRKKNIASIIRFHHMDIIGLQEPFIEQVHDLELLLPEFVWYGTGVEAGKEKGPIDAIFFRRSGFNLLKKSFFYLSPTPCKPSIGWDAKFKRGVCWVKLREKNNKKSFFFFLFLIIREK